MLDVENYWAIYENDNGAFSISFNNVKDLCNCVDDLINQGYEVKLVTETIYLTKRG